MEEHSVPFQPGCPKAISAQLPEASLSPECLAHPSAVLSGAVLGVCPSNRHLLLPITSVELCA